MFDAITVRNVYKQKMQLPIKTRRLPVGLN